MSALVDPAWDKIAAHVAAHVATLLANDPPRPTTPWLTPEDAAHYLRLAPKGLEQMRALGRGPRFSKVNARIVRYNVRDLDAWLAGATRD